MIIVYYSNKLESLKDKLINFISNNKLNDPFYSEVILVEHHAMMEWLHIELAQFFTISANINFFLSFDFIWNIVNKSLWNIFPKSMMTHSYISWVLMKILSKINHNQYLFADWSYIKIYLHNDINNRKCLQLSEKIADLFIKYFIYRQDWLIKWRNQQIISESDICRSWQIELWYLFLREIDGGNPCCYFQYNIYEYIIHVLKTQYYDNSLKLPKRILIYGISFFPPVLLDILKALGDYIDIYIYCINPCRFFLKKNLNHHIVSNVVMDKDSNFFQDILNNKLLNIFNKNDLSGKNTQHDCVNNLLLRFWGIEFQKNYCSLLDLNNNIYEYTIFSENTSNSVLLHILQDDILNDYSSISDKMFDISLISHNKKLNFKKERVLYSEDHSLSVHVCHSIQREIEVLHDNLLRMILDNKSISPHNIVVMAPNINSYIYAIRSVFSYASVCGRHLPFTILDSSVEDNINSIISIFLKLLNLSNIRCTIEEVLEFLKVESISAHFNIDKDEFKILSKWILESGIRWSLDDETFSDYISSSIVDVQCTWKFGITRMLLSYAIDSAHGSWNGVLPYDPSGNNIESINLVARLSQFIAKLKFWKSQLAKDYILEKWAPVAEKIILDFFTNDFNSETESTLILLKHDWESIIISGMQANYYEPISINILYDKLFDKLHKKEIRQRIFSGNIVFCNLSSMAAIPFEVVYLLGMNADIYPRSDTVCSFDLMAKNIRCSDYNKWCSECYLFLEALLAARKSFNISFIGGSMCNNERYPPSTLVSELFEYIVNNFYYFKNDQKEDISLLTMEWVYTNLWYWHTRVPFALENFISDSNNQSFYKEWLPNIGNNFNISHLNFLSKLSPIYISSVSLNDLYNFYNHPVRTWFQHRLKIYIPNYLNIPVDEPFFVDNYSKYQISNSLIYALLNSEDISDIYSRVRFSGVLPYGGFGELFWIKECQTMMQFAEVIKKHYMPNNKNDLKVYLILKNVQLHGVLSEVQENGLLRWKAGNISMRDGLLLWLEHLVYCAIGGQGDSYMFGMNNNWHFRALSNVEAKEYLSFLIFGYLHGLNIPLLLFSHSGGRWLRHSFDIKTGNISLDLNRQYQARCKLIEAWEGNKYIYGENCDPYVKKLIPQLNNENIECIILAAKEYFLLPMKFNIANILN